jgi:hypothetical protein
MGANKSISNDCENSGNMQVSQSAGGVVGDIEKDFDKKN